MIAWHRIDWMVTAVKAHDPGTKDRKVKEKKLGVLNRGALGPSVRACLVEIEFLDVKSVDVLFNHALDSLLVRSDVAKGIARAIVDDLVKNPYSYGEMPSRSPQVNCFKTIQNPLDQVGKWSALSVSIEIDKQHIFGHCCTNKSDKSRKIIDGCTLPVSR